MSRERRARWATWERGLSLPQRVLLYVAIVVAITVPFQLVIWSEPNWAPVVVWLIVACLVAIAGGPRWPSKDPEDYR